MVLVVNKLVNGFVLPGVLIKNMKGLGGDPFYARFVYFK